jgi:hypothetical protein
MKELIIESTMVECGSCGKKVANDRIEKHEAVCKKPQLENKSQVVRSFKK